MFNEHILTQVQDQKSLVNYYALCDENDEYLCTMEAILHSNSIIEITEKGKMVRLTYKKRLSEVICSLD